MNFGEQQIDMTGGKIQQAALTPTWYRQPLFWLMLLLNSAACLYLTHLVYKYRAYPFDGDEVNHALPSLKMAYALSQHAWFDFTHIFYTQSFYPPAIAGVKALSFLLFDPSFLHARLFSVAALFLAILTIYALCVEIDPQNGSIAGFVAAMLTLTASPLLINAALSMVELPGLLVSLLFLWAYVRVLKRATFRRLLMVSFLMVVTFLTKYTYGIVVLLTVGLSEVTIVLSMKNHLSWQELKSRIAGRWFCLFGPFLLVMTLWFLHPEKIAGLASFTQPLPSSESWLSVQNASSYLRSLAIHNLPSPLFVLVTAGALVWASLGWRQRPLRPLLLYFALGMSIIMLINHPVNPRFIITFVPAVHILTGLMIAFLLRQYQKRQRRALAMTFLSLIALSAILSAPNMWLRWVRMDSLFEVMLETDPTINEMVGWIQQQVPPGQTIFLVNYWDQLDSNLLAWYQGLRYPNDMAQSIDAVIITPPSDQSLASTQKLILNSQADYLVLFEGGPWGHPFWPEYTTALEDVLVPVARHEFSLTSFAEVQNWLDTASATEPAWFEVRREGRHTLTIQVIVFQLQLPHAASGTQRDNKEALPKFTVRVDKTADAVYVDEAETAAWEQKNPQPYQRDAYLVLYEDTQGTAVEPHKQIHSQSGQKRAGRPSRAGIGDGRAVDKPALLGQ